MEATGSRRDHLSHEPDAEDIDMTVTVTPRMAVAAARAYTLPTVREIPPVQRPGTFDSTW
jgi:hypothetical protein